MLAYKNYYLFTIHFLTVFFVYSQNSNEKTNTSIADSLDLIGEYDKAVTYRSLALKEINHSEEYIKFLEAKWHYSKSCSYELIGGLDYHNRALEHSLKARDITRDMSQPSVHLKQLLANRIYHQYGYVQNWKLALVEAQENLKILRDSLPDHSRHSLLVLDDLGFINNTLGDHINSLKYYEKVAELYKTHHKENKKDLAMNYSIMATNYRKLGMLKKEFQSINENERLWKETNEKLHGPLFNCYGKYSRWYTYYGNYNLAETYLNKQFKLIDSIEHKELEHKNQRRAKYLGVYANYIQLYIKKGDFKKASDYINLCEIELKESGRIFAEDITYEAALYYYKSKMPEHSTEISISYLKTAINLIDDYKETFPYFRTTTYDIEIFKKHKEVGQNIKAENQIKKLLKTSSGENEHKQFYFYSNYAQLLSQNKKTDSAKIYFNKAIDLFLHEKDSVINISEIEINQLKPYYSFESIEGFLFASDFYLNQFLQHNNLTDLKTAQNLYFLTADIFSNLYLGDRYNENLYITFKKIENGLLNCLEFNQEASNITRVIETIENNKSKLTWSKFLYSKEKQKLNIPDSIVDKEHDIKTLINHYQNELFNNKTTKKLDSDTLQNRITSLNLDLNKLRETIKTNYSNYYSRSFESFNLSSFRNSLESDELVLKYIFSEQNLYCVIISNSTIELKLINSPKHLKTRIAAYIKSLSTFNSNYIELSDELHTLILPIIAENKQTKIRIIPDGLLNYVPFESLLFNTNYPRQKLSKYSFSYATSLILLNEQNNISFINSDLNVGVFSSIDKTNNELPSASKETKSILNYFNGKLYENISKATFLKEANSYNILHLAMHSEINNENPDLSRLDFNDDHLLISELYNETINAQLVVLSACETGSGQIINGEGVQSISKAFTYTGIPCTVVSLWKVDDEATSKIMSQFYRHLKNGKAKDQALRNAKLDYLNSTEEEALKHPYYWAGFVITGNISPLVTSNTNFYWYVTAFAIILLLFLLRKKLYFFK